MTIFDKIFLVYLAMISIISIFTTILDKFKAKKQKRRISEKTLFVMSAMGGSATMYITMCIIRHKTQKNRFVFGIPAIFLLQCLLVFIMFKVGILNF